jgi:hypothetical protein
VREREREREIAFMEDILGLLEDVDLDITFSNSIAYSDVQIIS